ncbi:MAG: hypothetical protein JKX90_03520, partial [Colwellia sp.]|nr:hypothetical protein [Colwellia sp.]
IAALLLSIVVALVLIFALFYQQSERSRLLIDGELTPLQQQFKQLQVLQQAEYLVNELLFVDSGKNVIELQAELLAVNRQLLRLESTNTHLYQQWLNANKLTSDIVMRIHQGHVHNEQLKQSSIIQLQLMWFSVTPIINKKIAQQALLFKQLQTDHINDKLTFSRSNAYVSAIQQLHNLQQLKSLLAAVLTSFEQLTIHTSLEDLDLLRLSVEQIIAQGNTLKNNDKTKAMVDFNQKIATFEDIVLTQQRALAKWQGYIRLVQSYQLDLTMQSEQLRQILAEAQEPITVDVSNTLDDWLVKFNIKLTQKALSIILLSAISLSLFIFCYLLWRLRVQIKLSAQHGVVLIHKNICAETSGDMQANCADTQKIIEQVPSIAKPTHSEQEFQQLLEQYHAQQQVIDEQAQSLVVYSQKSNQQQLATSEQLAGQLNGELQRYKYLAGNILLLLQQQQARLLNKSINKPINNNINAAAQFCGLIPVYQRLKQFYLASDIRSKNALLTLVDVNLINEIYSVLFTKQAEQQTANNQLYFSYDEQLLVQAKLDFRLFTQLMHLLIDITLLNCRNTQLHLHLQLQDKSTGQQLVHFVARVKGDDIGALPHLVTRLIAAQTTVSQGSPLVGIFNILFAKQHGENLVADLVDGGFVLSFELPLAIASSSIAKKPQEHKLDGTKVLLLSRNQLLTALLEKFIQSASGEIEVLTGIDSFEQQLTAKRLSKDKLELLIVASDVAQASIDLISQQLSRLPTSLRPKLMLLQSTQLNFDRFGFYSQSEQFLCKDKFLHNIKALLVGEANTNQLLSAEQCQQSHYLATELPVLLAVHAPQQYQNLQRLLRWLGLQVQVVAHADAQRELWQTGLYSILISEFPETSLLEMASKPLVAVAVFSLTDVMPDAENKAYFADWRIGQLVEQSTLAELRVVLAPWLQYVKSANNTGSSLALAEKLIASVDEDSDEGNNEDNDDRVITELAATLAEDNNSAVFNFEKYLHHQGSVELALFMLDDYGQDNHQQLDRLIDAIKAKNLAKAQQAIIDLQLNAKVLAAAELEELCTQWSKLLSGNEIPTSLKEVNTLFKATRAALNAIDNYAESI